MDIVDTREKNISREQSIVNEARDRFHLVADYERGNRSEALDDLRMLAGKDHWPAEIVAKRKQEHRPVLTINKLPAFTDQVLNDSRINKTSIKILPYGGGSTPQLAEMFNGLIRNIENISDAEVAYQTALEGAVDNGFGYFRVITAYSDDTSFDQDIRIKRIRNPLTVYLDHHHTEHDGRDCRFGFITEKISRKEYEARYPNLDPPVPISDADEGYSLWVEEDLVRVAEYWVKEPTIRKIYLLSDKRVVDGDEWDKIADDLRSQERMIHLEPNPDDPENGPPIEVEGPSPEGTDYPQTVLNPTPTIVRERKVETHKVMQYFLDGAKIITETEWLGKYIPIIPVWGKEIVIDEERYLRGLIRFAKDPQRMYNYFRTAATETVALTPKAPYIMDERQIEGHETEWSQLNTKNQPYLLYKSIPGINAPRREVITQTAIGEITESNLANDEIKATTSLFDASLGAQGNEVSGRAIYARQRKGDVANFTYHDNLRRAIKYCGDILIDLVPKVYDTPRQLMITNEDDTEEVVWVNQTVVDAATGEKVTINDLSQGKYRVVATTGPSFTTQRVEAAQSMLDFVRVAPDAATFMIDLIAENMDWPGAVRIARRMKKLLPPDIDDEGPPQPEQPSLDDLIKQGKVEGIQLGNMLKKLNIVKDKRELEGTYEGVARAGAMGALQALGIGGEAREGG